MATNPGQRLARFKQEMPGLWQSLNAAQKDRITRAAGETGTYASFKSAVLAFPAVAAWVAANPTVGTPEEPLEDLPIEEPPPVESVSSPTNTGDDIRQILVGFLHDNDLPDSLITFINDALAQGMGATEIVARLRETPEYKAAYPENDLRRAAGFSWMPESQIRAARDEIRRITRDLVNVTLSPQETSAIIAKDTSLSEWEGRLRTFQEFKRWGPTVQTILAWELGEPISDDRAFAVMSPDISTPELTAAYERALMRGQPAVLGLGIRPEDEATLLRRYGISPEQAFKGYQGIVGEMPAAERFARIESTISGGNFPTGSDLFNDTPFATLFRAIQLGDTEAIRILQAQMARETSRFQQGGGATQSQGGTASGLLSREERAGV